MIGKFIQYTYLEFKLLFRVPIGLFFTVFFPQMLMFAFVIMSKNELVIENYYFIDVYLPVMMLLSFFSAGIISFAVIVAGNRSQKLWQVYRLRGFHISQIIGTQLLVNITLTFISSILLVVSAYMAFNARIGSAKELIRFGGVWLIIALAMFLIGFVIGMFSKTEKVAQAVSTPIMFLLMIFSGIMVDFGALPERIQNIMAYLPTTQANWILVKYWTGLEATGQKIHWGIIGIWIMFALCLITWKLKKDDFSRS